jgi:hypothetical protein
MSATRHSARKWRKFRLPLALILGRRVWSKSVDFVLTGHPPGIRHCKHYLFSKIKRLQFGRSIEVGTHKEHQPYQIQGPQEKPT